MGIFKLVRAMQERCSKPAFDNVHLVAFVVVSYFCLAIVTQLQLFYYNRKESEHQLLTNHFHTGITSSTMTKTITKTQVNLQLDNLQGTME